MLDEPATRRVLEAMLPWVAGQKISFAGEVPAIVRSACNDWASETSTRCAVVAWGETCDPLPGQVCVALVEGKVEAAESLVVQYLFADRVGVTLSTGKLDVDGFFQHKPPAYWLDSEPGDEVLATLIVSRGH